MASLYTQMLLSLFAQSSTDVAIIPPNKLSGTRSDPRYHKKAAEILVFWPLFYDNSSV